MPDTQQIDAEFPKYRYSIPQLLELSCTACLPFDLSKFTYEAARAGVIPSLDNCAMSSRKSSASYTKANNIEMTGNADILLFQGNRLVHPGRQPKLPPPAERQKDEGFARFLKKHASPTHNRVTAGGRIVPMKPRSPPAFTLSSGAVNRPQVISEDQEIRNIKRNELQPGQRGLANRQPYEVAEYGPEQAIRSFQTTVRPAVEPNDHAIPIFIPHQATGNLSHAQIGAEYSAAPALMPMRGYLPEYQMGGPVMPQHIQGPTVTYNPYYSPSTVDSAVPVTNDFGSSPTWSAFEQNFVPQETAQHMLPAYQLLLAWEQHYIDLDVQLKNIDRHRAMHQLDPYLAEQRKVIVQQRSDAKDTVREYQMMLGLRRMVDSSQDSFATTFNVDAPAYVPVRLFEETESMLRVNSEESAPNSASIDKPRGGTVRRAIPIVSPPEQSKVVAKPRQAAVQDITAQDTGDFDEWGVQNRPAPPEIHREQSRLSDMLQAEQRHLASGRDNVLQRALDNQSSDRSKQGASVDSVSDIADVHGGPVPITNLKRAPEHVPRDNADEMQQVMDAIGKPKGTKTQVRLLDSRVIEVEGQGLDLSSITNPPRTGWNAPGKASTRHPTPSLPYPRISHDAHLHNMTANQVLPVDRLVDKENILAAPKGHQKAATDAFLAQFNTVEDNVALAARPDNKSLRTASNGLVEERKYSAKHLSTPNDFLNAENAKRKLNNLSLNTLQDVTKRSMADQDSMSFQTATSTFADELLNKGYSSVSVQNINAVGRLPQNLDGTVDARQIAQAHLAAADKAKSPRLFKRHGINGSGTWYGPYCRDMFDRARTQNDTGRPTKKRVV